jgi:hypothetical protein
MTLERYTASMAGIVGILRTGREERPQAADLPDLLEPVLIGGMAGLVTGVLLAEEHERLPAMETELVEILLTPYLGRDEARRVAG